MYFTPPFRQATSIGLELREKSCYDVRILAFLRFSAAETVDAIDTFNDRC